MKALSRRALAAGGLSALLTTGASGAEPALGRLIEHKAFASKHVPARTVWVWLPPGDQHAPRSVLYMHDGQNLFDATRAGYGVEWGIDEKVSALAAQGVIRAPIVVGIESTRERRVEHQPESIAARLPPDVRAAAESALGGKTRSAAYIAFLCEEVVPFVEGTYPVSKRRRFVMGSSMGGLISLEAFLTRPGLFAGAGCVSTHWPLRIEPIADPAALLAWQRAVMAAIRQTLADNLPKPQGRKLWFDYGDQGIDAHYAPFQTAADLALVERGWRQGRDFVSRYYPGADHNEKSWNARVNDPLTFLFGKETPL